MSIEGRFLLHLALSGVVIAAALYDARTRRVPNRLVYPLALIGLALAVARTGWGDFTLTHWSHIGLAFVIAAVLLFSGAYGGGDAKLFAALSLYLPTGGYLYAQLAAFGIGALVVFVLNDPAARWQEGRALWSGLVRGRWPTIASEGAIDSSRSRGSDPTTGAKPHLIAAAKRMPATWQLALGALAAMWVVPLAWPGL